MKNSPYLSFSE